MQETRTDRGIDLAGSYPVFPRAPGNRLGSALTLTDFRKKRLLFQHFDDSESIHVYQADCRAGERLRVQMVYPILEKERTAEARFAVIGQSLPYSADIQDLPLQLPTGFRAVVAPQMNEWRAPVTDILTRASYYPGPIIDTRVLVSGRCYIMVWTTEKQPGKYVLQVGHRWPLRWSYWAQVPLYWWSIRGWFGLSRAAAYALGAGIVIGLLTAWMIAKRGKKGELNV